jgi:hypothetical protein
MQPQRSRPDRCEARVFSSVRNWLGIVRSAYSSWSAVLGTIIATIALCNFVFTVMHASLIEAVKLVLAAYQKTFHPPIEYVLSHLSIHLPAAGKDLLVLYLAVGGILYRTLSYERPSGLRKAFPTTWQSRIRDLRRWVTTIIAAAIWPFSIGSLLRYPCLLIESRKGYHGRLPPPRSDLSPAKRKDVIETLLSQIGEDARVVCNERQLLASYAIGLFIAVVGLVALNAAIDGLSEKFTH